MIEILPLELKYCEDVARISKECLPEYWSLGSVCDLLKYDNNIYYVVKNLQTNEVVAFAGIMIVGDEAELLNIAVSSEYRKCGIAQKLLGQLCLDAKRNNAYRMLLEVRESNVHAKALYWKVGFSDLGRRKNYYSNPREDAIIMERML
ncbi:MAG: ribosomal protein S18-alanine N-acetyltransferase [Lachnospiraceae bacterium]|nr:ribosomal protein S18-alanine N-acetyltransferase [Lachnospiraceae bacterium]